MSCPICGGGEWRPRFTAQDMYDGSPSPVVDCAGCGLWRTGDGRATEDLGALYRYGSGTDAGSRRPPLVDALFRALQGARVRQALRGRAEPGRILDVGCGSGSFLGEIAARGWDVLGLEIDAAVADTARRSLGSERVVVAPFERAELPPGRFDVITFWHTLEHFADPLMPLLRARQLLAPGGAILVGVPNIASWQARISGRAWLHLDVPRHRWHFAPATLAALAARADLAVVSVEHFSLEYGPYGLFQSGLARLGLGHVLYGRFLGPGRATSLPTAERLRLWAHAPLAPLLALLAALSLPLELLAAALGHGGAIVARLAAAGESEHSSARDTLVG